jgi:acyl carrier protein
MKNGQIELQELFRDVFDEDDLEIGDEMDSDDIPAWDSLMHINLMVAAEKKFNIRFTTAEMAQLKKPGQNIGSFRRLIAQKLSSEQA